MTLAEKRIIQFLHKTNLNGAQMNALVEITGRVSRRESKEALVRLLHDGIILLSADRILSLAPPEEDNENLD